MNTPKKQNKHLIVSLAVITICVAIVALAGFFIQRPADDYIQGQAEVDEYRVSSKVPGRILRFYVKEGQRVAPGDTLALLEAPDIEAKMTQARAAEEAAAAQDAKARKGAREEQVRSAHEIWKKAQAALTIAEKSYARVKRLHEGGVMPAQKLDEATAQRDAAAATEKAAKAQYDMARNGAEREDREAARAIVERARGAVAEVRSYLNETVLLAREAGEVSDIFPKTGELVGSGAPIMNIAYVDSVWVTFNVREDDLAAFGMDQEFEARVPALGNQTVRLRVHYLKDLGSYAAWRATKTTGQFDYKTFEVRATPLTSVKGLRAGMSVLYDKTSK